MARGFSPSFFTKSAIDAAAVAPSFASAGLGGSCVNHALMSRLHQPARHVAAHFAESDHTDLHLLRSL
jgi:hypothetical protein